MPREYDGIHEMIFSPVKRIPSVHATGPIMSFLTRFALLFVIGTGIVSAEDDDITYIKNEFLLVVDDAKANATDADFTQKLEDDFQLKVTAIDHFTKITVFGVSGDAADVDRVKALPEVVYAEQNAVATLDAKRTAEFPCSVCHKVSATQAWGLDRVDQREKLLSDDPFNLDADYMVGPHRGAGVVAYVVDTGTDATHPDFEGRAFCLHSAFGSACIDDHGHGTHVAGTIGSRRHGVAKEVTLVGVKVFRGAFGTTSSICNGLAWVLRHHNSRWNFPVIAKSVVNMSFRTSYIIRYIVDDLIDAGITAVAAAGNNNGNACYITPARVPRAITVGATTVDDESAFFTNWGNCVDVFAPGFNVMSTRPRNTVGAMSGTSMAAPHVSGAAAVEMSRRIGPTSPKDIHEFIISESSKGKIAFSTANHNTSPNRLLHVPCCDMGRKDEKIINDK